MMQADISAQTLDDLAALLSVDKQVPPAVLTRLTNEEDQLALIALANEEWLTGALTIALKNKGYWHELTSQLQAYLEEMAGQFAQRNVKIKTQLSELAKVFAEQKIELLALKGSAYLLNGVLDEPAQRFMTDVDLLVPEAQLEKAKSAMTMLGYKNESSTQEEYSAHHHLSPYSKPEAVANIELHTKPVTASMAQYFSSDQAWQQAVPLTISPQTKINQLSPNWQFLLQIIHSEMSDEGYYLKELNLRQLYTLVLLVKRFEQELDWAEISAYCQQHNFLMIVQATLYQAYRLFALKTPLTPITPKKPLESLSRAFEEEAGYINRFEQGKANLLRRYQPLRLSSRGLTLIKKYSPDYIQAKYGDGATFPYLSGCLKQLRHHLKMLRVKLISYLHKARN